MISVNIELYILEVKGVGDCVYASLENSPGHNKNKKAIQTRSAMSCFLVVTP